MTHWFIVGYGGSLGYFGRGVSLIYMGCGGSLIDC
jgi:hypothetical protein